ncbi:MAG TPA: acyltransferase family protein, partial [Acetobacteraceae bacterium]|nr:acyltransferase family protein [Acetobacteraceae bacterium]
MTALAPPRNQRERLLCLDGLRGLAALVVVAFHFSQHYWADLLNRFHAVTGLDLFNGPASVSTFFVLSGFVLYVAASNLQRPSLVVGAALKRWPRLAGPAIVAGLLLAAVAGAGLYPSPADVAAQTSKANYFVLYGYSRGGTRLADTIWEAAIGSFKGELPWFNPVLWTMHFELIGSFLVFAAVALRSLKSPALRAPLILALSVVACWYSAWMIGFVFGIALAVFWTARPRLNWNVGPLASVLFGSLFVLVFLIGQADTRIAELSAELHVQPSYCWMMLQAVASTGMVALGLWSRTINVVLSTKLCRYLGRYSFPAYLIHFTVLYSF